VFLPRQLLSVTEINLVWRQMFLLVPIAYQILARIAHLFSIKVSIKVLLSSLKNLVATTILLAAVYDQSNDRNEYDTTITIKAIFQASLSCFALLPVGDSLVPVGDSLVPVGVITGGTPHFPLQQHLLVNVK